MNYPVLFIAGLLVFIIFMSGYGSADSLITQKIQISPSAIDASQVKYNQLITDVANYMKTKYHQLIPGGNVSNADLNLTYQPFFDYISSDQANVTVKFFNGPVWNGIWIYNGKQWVPVDFKQIK
ncbi:MAG TPA: hypothetical protein VK444_09155 [Methanobacteriaceae archaeon]|nr:hypothetical protein [Methanobacteriaceae archaeon]